MWVIAETKDLPTNFIKIVVTDDQGRFMVPELPAANYRVWVRGYGLVDSTPIQMKPATNPIALTATPAKTPQEAAKVYPGNYWLSLLEPPAPKEFPGTGRAGQRARTEHADPEPLDQLAQVRLQLLSSARQPAHAQRRSRLQGEARAQDARGGLGVAARHRRPRHVDVRRAQQSGQGPIAQGLLRTGPNASRKAKCRRRRRVPKASSAISS